MANDDMNHVAHLSEIAQADVSVLEGKEKTYQGSWKKAGGRSAWFMFRRNMDRLLSMCKKVDFRIEPSRLYEGLKEGGEVTLTSKEVEVLMKALASEDIFALIAAEPSGADGTVLACLRDLRRYALLLESEMVAQGTVAIEWGPEGKSAIDTSALTSIGANLGEMDYGALEARIASLPARDQSVSQKDENRCRALVAAASLYTLGDAELDRLTAEVTDLLKIEGDTYEAIGKTLSIPRNEVKRRCFHVMYGTGRRPTLPEFLDLPTPEKARTILEQFNAANSRVERDWERRAIEQTLRYIGQPVPVQDVMGCRPGGGIIGRVAETTGGSEDEITLMLTSRAYAEPDEEVGNAPPLDFHKELSRAVAHSLNYHSVDAALNCADHILAELLVPEILKHLKGLTDVQLVEQGWTFGPHGQPTRPQTAALPDDPKDPSVPGTPADGGHHDPEGKVGCEAGLISVVAAGPAIDLSLSAARTAFIEMVGLKLVNSDFYLEVQIADHGARKNPGPNKIVQIVRLLGMGEAFGIRVAGSVENWRLLSHESLSAIGAVWFPGSETRMPSPSEFLARQATDAIRRRAGSPLDPQS